MKKNPEKIKKEISKLEDKLEELEIKLKFATQRDLPYRIITKKPPFFTYTKTIEDINDYKYELRDQIKFIKKEIELIKLKYKEIFDEPNLNGYENKDINTILDKPSIIESSDEMLIEEKEETQREKIIAYLLENYPNFKNDYIINMNELAFEITNILYPSLQMTKRRRKKESIRQELMLIRNGRITFE